MKISNEENSLKIVDVGEEVLQEGEAVGAACVRPQLVIPDQNIQIHKYKQKYNICPQLVIPEQNMQLHKYKYDIRPQLATIQIH